MITANTQPAQLGTLNPEPGTPTPACPACGFPVRRIYAGELICPSCAHREALAKEFWERIQAACLRGVRL